MLFTAKADVAGVKNKGEVLFANEALVLAGNPLGEGETDLSSPITSG